MNDPLDYYLSYLVAITSSVASMVSQKVYVGVLTKLSPNFSLMAITLRSNGVSTRTSEDIRAIASSINVENVWVSRKLLKNGK